MAAFLGTLHTVAGASSAQLTRSLPTCSVIGNIKCALVIGFEMAGDARDKRYKGLVHCKNN